MVDFILNGIMAAARTAAVEMGGGGVFKYKLTIGGTYPQDPSY